MPGRVGQVTPTSVKRRKRRRKPATKEVAGPYRSQSSKPSIRAKATKREHRREPATVEGVEQQEARRERKAGRKAAALKATRKARRQSARKAHRIEQRTLKTLRKTPPTPAGAVQEARQGVKPPESKSWRKAFPEAAKQADKAFIEHVASKEGVKPDPLAEFGISTVATLGVGAAAKGAATLAKSALAARAGSKLASTGEKAVETGAKGVAARTASKAGTAARAGAKRVKTRSKRNLAAHEANQAASRAARRIRPKAKPRYKVKAGQAVRKRRVRYGKEGRKVARRTRSARVGLLTPYATATGGGVAGLGAAGAAVVGHVTADPRKAVPRTLEIAPGMIVSTADLVAQAAKAGVTGDTEGLRKRLSEDLGFAKEMAEVLTSGNEKRIRDWVEKNGYVAPLVLGPSVLRAGGTVRGVRARSRDPIARAEKEAAQSKALSKVKGVGARKGRRMQLSKDAARAQAEAQAEIAEAGMPVVRAYTGHRGKKGVKGRRKLRDKPVDRGDVMALVAEEGLTPTRIGENFEAVARKWGDRPVFADKRKGGVTGHELIDYVASDPGIWKDKAFWEQVARYREQEPAVRRSERVVDVEQAKTHGVQLVEDRPTPTGRTLIPGVKSREDVAAYISKSGEGGKRVRRLRETIRAAEGKARELRAELRQLETGRVSKSTAGLRGLELGRRKQTVALVNRRRQQLLDTEADVRGMRAELAGTKRRHKAIYASLRDPAESAAVKREFDAELAAVREDRGLARGAYIPHTDVGRGDTPVAQPITRAGKKIYKRATDERSLAERGRVDYNLGTILDAGIQAPRIRDHMHRFVDRAVHEGAVRFKDRDGKIRRVGTREQLERGLSAEQKAKVEYWPIGQINQAVRDENVPELERLIDGIGNEIEAMEGTKGHKYIALERDYSAELKAQVSAPGSFLYGAQVFSRGVSRSILMSPAWVEAQIVAEGLQAAHAINPLNPFNIGHLVQGYRGLREMSPEKRRELRANAGALPGMGVGPREFFTASGKTQRGLADNFRRYERVWPFKRLLQAVRFDWGRAIDRAKGGELRVAVAVAKAHKDAMGFGKRLERVVKGQRAISEKLAKMTPGELLEWSIRDTPAKRRQESYLDDLLGNWRAYSRHEKRFAPALIFYGFLRMSLRWPFYTLPKRHPVRAAIMYELAASHNNQLRELLGGPPAWFGEYATAILYGDEFKGGARTIKASRIVPGANAIFEALNAGADVAAQRALNPVAGVFNALINGIDPLSGEKVDPAHLSTEEKAIARAGLATSVLLGLNPGLRAADQLKGPKESKSLPFVGERYPESALGELLEELNGSPEDRALQTVVNPFPSADADKARDRAAMGRIFDIWRTAGSEAQSAVKNDSSLTKRQKEAKLRRMQARSDEADNELTRLYKKYEVAYQAEEKQRLKEWSDLTFDLKPPPMRKARRLGTGIGGPSLGGIGGIGGGGAGGRIGGTGGGPIGGGAGGGIGGYSLGGVR